MAILSRKKADRCWCVEHWDEQRNSKGFWHSFEFPDGTRIDGVCDLAGLKNRIAQFPIPADLAGKRVLDIGAWDGWFSFEMERRGAEVMAVDNWDNQRFRHVHARLGSRVDYRQMDVYELTPERIGRFDIVLFMGVLYHLKHPLLALERVCALATDLAAVDSFVLREEHRPSAKVDDRLIMEFYETNEFGGQTDNWVGPNLACLMAFCRTAGFARVELLSVIQHSACVACYRQWANPPSTAAVGPAVVKVEHNTNEGINFDSIRDEYVSAWFESHEKRLSLDHVKPEVGGYGVRPIHLAQVEEERWQTNFKLPPGLIAGWHDVRVRVGDSLPGAAQRIVVDVPLPQTPIEITGACDGVTWVPNRVDLGSDALSLWIAGLPDNADRNNVRVYLDGDRVPVTYVEAPRPEPRQVNAHIPSAAQPGIWIVEVALGGQRTPPVQIEVAGA